MLTRRGEEQAEDTRKGHRESHILAAVLSGHLRHLDMHHGEGKDEGRSTQLQRVQHCGRSYKVRNPTNFPPYLPVYYYIVNLAVYLWMKIYFKIYLLGRMIS